MNCCSGLELFGDVNFLTVRIHIRYHSENAVFRLVVVQILRCCATSLGSYRRFGTVLFASVGGKGVQEEFWTSWLKDGTGAPSRNDGKKLPIVAAEHSRTVTTITAHCLSQGGTADAQFELLPPPGSRDERNWEL